MIIYYPNSLPQYTRPKGMFIKHASVMWCMSSQLTHIQVTLYTINAVEYTRSMARLWRGFVNSDPVTDIHLKTKMCMHSSAVISRSNLPRYYIGHCDSSGRKRIIFKNHNRHPILRPHGRTTGCLLWGFRKILTALWRPRAVVFCADNA